MTQQNIYWEDDRTDIHGDKDVTIHKMETLM